MYIYNVILHYFVRLYSCEYLTKFNEIKSAKTYAVYMCPVVCLDYPMT